MTGGRQAPRLFCFFFLIPSEASLPGAGASRDGSAHQSQAWELATWAPSSSGPTILGWRVYFLVSVSCSLNVVLSVLRLPAWAGIGLENKRPPSVSDRVQCSQPPNPSPEPLHHGGHTGLGSEARCLSEMGFEGAGGLWGGAGELLRGSVGLCAALRSLAEVGLL